MGAEARRSKGRRSLPSRPSSPERGPGRKVAALVRPDRSLIRRLAGETEGDAKCRSAVERRHCELYYPRSQTRWLLFDWSNRVIGHQDPDYASSASFDPDTGTSLAREALRLRPVARPDGQMPDPRSRAGMPDPYAYAHLLAEEKRRSPGSDVMSILLAEVDADGGRVSVEEFENLFWLFAIAGNETLRNGLPGGMIALLVEHPWAQQALRDRPALLPSAVEEMLRWPACRFRPGTRSSPASTKVVVSFIAANRDEAVFPSPDVFDIARCLLYTSPSPRD